MGLGASRVIHYGRWCAGKLPHWKCLFDEISARPAAIRASALNERHLFKTEMDEEAPRNMLWQNLTPHAA